MTTDVLTSSFIERPLVYIAAPYRSNPTANTNRAIAVADKLHESNVVTCVVPHLTLLWDTIIAHDEDHWLAYDMALLDRCEALLRLPGYSPGADAEVDYAYRNDILVFFDEESLLWWAADQVDE